MIYLASPYNHPDPAVREDRFIRVCKVAGRLLAQGITSYCAIAHTHPIEKYAELPPGWDYWQKMDEEFLALAEKLVVVKMEGWDKSEGITAEIARTQALGKAVEFIDEHPSN
jgi:hypothetical protein